MRKYELIKERFDTMVENNIVFFEKKYINKGKHEEIKYFLYLIKEREPQDEDILVRDRVGRLVKEVFVDPNWVVLNKQEYLIEEKFTCYGYDKKLPLKDIIKLFIMDNNNIKYVYYFLNKVIIEDFQDFNIIVTKNHYDARRLHDTMDNFVKQSNRTGKCIFMNELSNNNRDRIYDEIKIKTKWKPSRLYRNSTRP